MIVVSFLWCWMVSDVVFWVVVMCECGGVVIGGLVLVPKHRVVVWHMLEVLCGSLVVWGLCVGASLVVWLVVGGFLWVCHSSHSNCAFVGKWFSSGSWHKWVECG